MIDDPVLCEMLCPFLWCWEEHPVSVVLDLDPEAMTAANVALTLLPPEAS